jgi:hypothetical protein
MKELPHTKRASLERVVMGFGGYLGSNPHLGLGGGYGRKGVENCSNLCHHKKNEVFRAHF